ncbi:MAG: winged helix-turn-helix domain-containing protein, partial [Dissulfuribacterales bacterium]
MTGKNNDQVGVFDKQLTIREKIIRYLEAEPMSATDLSKALRISEKDAYSHLPSIQKSITHQEKQIKTTPCYCWITAHTALITGASQPC